MNYYIELCQDAAEDALSAFPISEYPNEYNHAKNMYKLLLLGCCCFILSNKGEYSNKVYEIEKELAIYDLPFTFTTWVFLIYINYIESQNSEFENREYIDGFRRCEGSNIGEYIFDEFRDHFAYDMVIVDLWDTLEITLEKIK